MSPPIYQTGPYIAPNPLPVTGSGTAISPSGLPVAVDPTTGQAIDPSTGLPVDTSGTSSATSGGFDLSSLTSMSIFGIPVLYIALGIGAYMLLKKR